VLVNVTLAQGPGPERSGYNWQASYWNNTTLSGSPVLVRSEANLNHDWGTGSPDPSVNADRFSARWIRVFFALFTGVLEHFICFHLVIRQ
jgi:hypothetical protein